MEGKVVLGWAICLAMVLLAEGFSPQAPSKRTMSLGEIQQNIGLFVEEGFTLANRNALAKNSPTYTYDHHGRKVNQKLKKALACVKEGNRRTKKLILQSLEMPEGMSRRDALRNITYGQREYEIIKKTCNTKILSSASNNTESRGRFFFRGEEFRTADGSGNNPNNFGVAGSVFKRILLADYEGDECGLVDRGNPRVISNAVSEITKTFNAPVTVMLMQFGQFLDHDMTLFKEITEFDECCGGGAEAMECADIDVSADDPFFGQFGVTCLPFARSFTGAELTVGGNCEDRFNLATAFIDGSQIYGNSEEETEDLREFFSARLRTSGESEVVVPEAVCDCAGVSERTLEFLPLDEEEESEEFLAGDPRVNEQPGLASLHTVFLRYHNLLADTIRRSSFFSNDVVFQQARKFVIASLQRITYLEFLPLLMSAERLSAFGLDQVPFLYDPDIEVGIFQEFATATFRMGHTLIPETFDGIPLVTNFERGEIIREPESTPSIILNSEVSNEAEAFDTCLVNAVRNQLFAEDIDRPGQDLHVRNIQRCRDHGLRRFNAYRRRFDLEIITRGNIEEIVREGAADLLRNAYDRRVRNMDLFTAGLAEKPTIEGDQLGPVFMEIFGAQFNELKFGDRFWYENDIFTPAELDAIEGTTLADILCETTCIDEIQPLAMAPVSETNVPESCIQRRLSRDRTTVLGLLKGRRWW